MAVSDSIISAEKVTGEEVHLEDLGHETFSDDVHDPLNWPTTQKLTVLAVLCVWMYVGTANIVINGPAFPAITQEFQISFATASYLIAGSSLAYGSASLIWVGVANRYGVRLTFVLCALAGGLVSIWGAKATTFSNLLAARIISSAFLASPEVLAPQVIGDVFHLKYRARAVTTLLVFEGAGFPMGPLIGAYIYSDHGWRWTQWIMVILLLATAVLLFLFFPETQYTASTTADKTRRTYIDSLRFWRVSGGGTAKVHSLVSALLYPIPYILHPVVMMITFWGSVMVMVTNYVMTVSTFAFTQVYGFSVKATGTSYVAPLIGILVAVVVSGYMADWYEMRNLRIAAKSGVKPHPETRFVLLLITGSMGVAGTALFGACLGDKCHWIGPMAGSFGCLFSFVAGLSILYAYLMDVYEARTDAVLVMFNGIKNIAGFGITYAVFPWTAASGFTVPHVVLAMILLAAHLIVGAFYFIGPGVRKWTAAKFVTGRASKHGDTF